MILDKVSITGADDSVNPKDLVELSEEFPFVEWAILLSKSRMRSNRYPSLNWMYDLKQFAPNLILAGYG